MNSSIDTSNLQSVRAALGVASLRMAMNQDAMSVAKLMESMEQTTAKAMELSVTPYKGANIDIKA